MKPEEFKKWRKSLGLSQKNAAEMLGLKIRIIQYCGQRLIRYSDFCVGARANR